MCSNARLRSFLRQYMCSPFACPGPRRTAYRHRERQIGQLRCAPCTAAMLEESSIGISPVLDGQPLVYQHPDRPELRWRWRHGRAPPERFPRVHEAALTYSSHPESSHMTSTPPGPQNQERLDGPSDSHAQPICARLSMLHPRHPSSEVVFWVLNGECH